MTVEKLWKSTVKKKYCQNTTQNYTVAISSSSYYETSPVLFVYKLHKINNTRYEREITLAEVCLFLGVVFDCQTWHLFADWEETCLGFGQLCAPFWKFG